MLVNVLLGLVGVFGVVVALLWVQYKRLATRSKHALQEAEAASTKHLKVLGATGHELRNPLHAIVMHSETLLQTVTPEQRASALTIQGAVDVLLTLAGDLSAYATTANPAETAELQLAAIIDDLHTRAGPIVRGRGVHFEVHVEPGSPTAVRVHPALTHIIKSLVSHSVAVTTQGHVEVTIHATENRPDAPTLLRISVEDTSALPADAAATLFEPMGLQGQTYQGNPTGTALHLHIARKVARELGGDLLHTPRAAGALFELSVPVTVLASQAEIQHQNNSVVGIHDIYAHHRSRVGRKRVLVAEDQESNQRVIAGALEKAGHNLVLASTGDEALVLLGAEAFDVVILDLRLPGIHGLNILKLSSIMPTTAATAFIVLTGDSDPETERACRGAGAAAFLPKPLSARRLLDSIEELAAATDTETRISRHRPGPTSRAVIEGMADALRYVAEIEQSDGNDWSTVVLRVRALRGIAHAAGCDPLRLSCNQLLELPADLPADRRRQSFSQLAASVDGALLALGARGKTHG